MKNFIMELDVRAKSKQTNKNQPNKIKANTRDPKFKSTSVLPRGMILVFLRARV